ncbi:S8 family peptidase [Sphingomonas sp. SUN039]|uniref:S8 family peptidase n=1 Tax=Sphingomonas sp. SUN039 TaxID=2937787 RepID=UPI0021644604|nr:S8 family peptidase [Sphingomonas sp. SUN039]UVO54703.1 S8 family serine peptidase [Sphingomonas sp. SUN039]
MTAIRARLLAGLALPLGALAGCGGGESGGSVASTPTPTPVSVTSSATPAPTPTPTVNYDTAEYRRSNAAAQAQALTAYNAGATGAGVLVGVIDSGVDATSSEFAGRISPLSADFAGSRGIQDEGGHGTAVSDVLLGARNDTGIHGVAFNATLLALRTDTPGTCASATGGSDGCTHNDNNIAAALDAAVSARARVVNISLGGTPANTRLRGAIDRATAAGTIIVIAAGNEGVTNPVAANNPDMLAQVANDPIARGLVIIAGATDSTGVLADFSNRAGNGATNYLAALGSRVRAVDETGTSYLYSGTSFAAPVISGAVALIAQAFPTLTPAQIVALLYRSADDRGATGVDTVYGNGEINLARAFGPIGSLSLPGSAVPVSLSANATLGGAMGDAVKGSLSAVIRDEFGRDFGVDLAPTLTRTAVRRTLAGGLALLGRNLSAAGGRTSFALAIDDRESARPLMLTSREAGQARVLAGSMTIAVSKDLKLGFGGGVGADGLLPDAQHSREPAFLVTDRSLDRAPLGAFAVRQAFGRIGVTLAAESGQMQLWQRGEVGPMADGVRRYAYSQVSAGVDGRAGPVALTAKLSRLDERATVLGSRFGAALGGNGAVSWFADVGATVSPGENMRLGATWRRGWTGLGANSVRGHSVLLTQGLSGTVTRDNLWVAGDSLALRYSEPLRVTGGGLDLLALGSMPQLLSLTPSGRERDWEAVYARPLGRGWLTANTYLRRQAGHYATAPDDLGAAVRYSFGF